MTLSSAPVANSAAPLQLSAAEAWQHLKELDRQIDQVVLQRCGAVRNPVSYTHLRAHET